MCMKCRLTEARIDGELLRDVQALFECAFHAARLLFGARHSQVLRLANELAVVLTHVADAGADGDSDALETAERLLLASVDACARERPLVAALMSEARTQAARRDRENESEARAKGHWREWLAERWYRYQSDNGAPVDALDLVIRPHLRAFAAAQRESARLEHLHAVLHANLSEIYSAAAAADSSASDSDSDSNSSGPRTSQQRTPKPSTSTRSTTRALDRTSLEAVLAHVRAAAATATATADENQSPVKTAEASTGREVGNTQQPGVSISAPETSEPLLKSGRTESAASDWRRRLQLEARVHCETAKKLSSRNDDKELRVQIADCLKRSSPNVTK